MTNYVDETWLNINVETFIPIAGPWDGSGFQLLA